MNRTLPLIAVAAVALLATPREARAQGILLADPPVPRIVEPPSPVPRPLPIPLPRIRPQPQALSVRSQKVTLDVDSGVMKVTVEQVFYNPNNAVMEGTYLFPLPEGATIQHFRMTVDNEPTDGKLLTREEARRIYESYVRRNIDPALLEYAGRNAFQARVFPIPAGGEKRIFLGYTQPLRFQNGVYQVVYPLNNERVTGQTIAEFDLACTLKSRQPLKAIYSPTHEVQVKRESDHLASAAFSAKELRANRDFLLYYSTSEKEFGLNALAYRRQGEDGYLLLMLAPERETDAADVQPKDLVLVVDTSGSMQGVKIEQAKKALHKVVASLNDQDRFNIVRFSSETAGFRNAVVPATVENRAAARAWIDEIKAAGGTAINDALEAGFASLPPAEARPGRAPFVVFITDGLPTIGETAPDRILANARSRAPKDVRLFGFGVGADVNTLLLDRLAGENRGVSDYVSADEDLEARIAGFYSRIADPVLANVKVAVVGAEFKEVYPRQVPDLFAGSQLLMVGRYSGQGQARVVLTGEVNGNPRRFEYAVSLAEREPQHDFLPRLWGGRKIGFLLEEIRLHGENDELKNEVVRLSKEYGIITPYTSYLVEEPNLVLGGARLPELAQPATSLQVGAAFRFSVPLTEASGAGGAMRGGSGPQGPAGQAGADRNLARPGPGGYGGGGQDGRELQDVLGRLARGAKAGTAVKKEAERQMALQRRVTQQADGFGKSTGWNAVEASKQVNALKDKRLADSDVELKRVVEERTFVLNQAGYWVESGAHPAMRQVVVQFGSDAYFQLARSSQSWSRILALGRQVVFKTGPKTLVVVEEQGRQRLTPTEIKNLTK